MQSIINGKLYDTDTAREVCDLSPVGLSRTDFAWENTKLYRSPAGAFFIAGEGGARSRWAQPMGDNGHTGGWGMRLVDEDAARELCEEHGTVDTYADVFGAPALG